MHTLFFAFLGCTTAPVDSGSADKDGASIDDTADTADTDSGGTEETGETGDSAVVEPVFTELTWDYENRGTTTREPITIVVTAHYDDGSEMDATETSTWFVDDPTVAQVYVAGVLQPLNAGTVQVNATYMDTTLTGYATISVSPIQSGDLVFNEALADGTVDGDPNADGTVDAVEDEFLEIANYSDVTVDLSGCTIVEDDFYTGLPRHTFAEGTLLHAGEAIVVFGGGEVSAMAADHVQFVAATNEDSGLQYGLSLNNEGEHVELRGPAGDLVASVAYGDGTDNDAVEDASLVLSPDVWGTVYTHHHYATGSIGDYSPGTFVDGSAFPGPDARYAP